MSIEKYKIFVVDKNADDSVDALTETASSLLDYLGTHRIEDIDFTGFKVNEVNPQHLCVILRLTYIWSSKIKGWDEALSVAKEASLKNNFEPSDILYGLL